MGAVYEALNTWTQRRVALKLLHTDVANTEGMIERFFREARAAGSIGHPNIIDVLDMGHDDASGAYFIVQELLRGQSLRAYLDARRTLTTREALEVLAPVMSALVAAHQRGIVHRDLKPENIFIQRTEAALQPKLIDFGIAKMASDDGVASALTVTGAIMGTPFYMSPEQAKGERDVGPATDVWAMGVVWFEALTGHCPFEGANYNAVLAKILTESAPRLVSLPGIDRSVADVVDRALEKDRSLRFSNMQMFLDAMMQASGPTREAWHRELRSSLARTVPSEPVPDVDESEVPRPGSDRFGPSVDDRSTVAQAPREISRSRQTRADGRALAIVGFAGLLALGVGTGVLVRASATGAERVVRAPQTVTPLSPTGVQRTFAVRVRARPPSAQLVLDGEPLAGGCGSLCVAEAARLS